MLLFSKWKLDFSEQNLVTRYPEMRVMHGYYTTGIAMEQSPNSTRILCFVQWIMHDIIQWIDIIISC
jgi:hypothetical protein